MTISHCQEIIFEKVNKQKKKFTGSKYIFQTRIYNDTFYWLRYVIYDLIGLKNCRKEHGFQL